MDITGYQRLAEGEPERRIVLVGKTGVGKSATGNTILGKKAFDSSLSLSSVTSVCEKETSEFVGLKLDVIDTPGLFGTDKSNEEIVKEITKCISLAAPGSHVFLIVLQPNRFTAEEARSMDIIQKTFGDEAAKYTMVLFTQGDMLREKNATMEDLLETSQPLKQIISQCSILDKFEDKYHVFDNNVEDPAQVRRLLRKINRMVEENGGSYYTNEMFEEAQRAKQEEMERLFRENPNITPEDAKRQAERDNSFIRAALAAAKAAVGAAAGAGLGVGAGAAINATVTGAALGVGVAAGGLVGALVGTALVVKEMACIIQ